MHTKSVLFDGPDRKEGYSSVLERLRRLKILERLFITSTNVGYTNILHTSNLRYTSYPIRVDIKGAYTRGVSMCIGLSVSYILSPRTGVVRVLAIDTNSPPRMVATFQDSSSLC